VTAIASEWIFACNGTGTAIKRRIETVASLASLVRVASGFYVQPRRTSPSGCNVMV
jgi:hypothetical protein